MSTAVTTPQSPAIETLADLLERLGNVPLERIRFRPAPGTATSPPRAQAGGQLLAQLAPGLHEHRLVDGLVRHPPLWFVGMVAAKPLFARSIVYLCGHAAARSSCVA